MEAAALRHQRKSGEMSASGRLQKRTGTRHKFPLYPLFIFVCFLNTWKKQKQKAKGGRSGLALVVLKVLLRCLLLVKKSPAPLLF